MPNYHYYVHSADAEEKWKPIQSSQLGTIQGAMFVTVLSVDKLVDDGISKEDRDKLRYSGPMYFDWDGPDISDVVPNVLKLVAKLVEKGVSAEQLRFYATGSKGFHCEIPPQIFLEKPNPKGYEHLPAIYKEMAFAFAVDTLDLRVYSARKGRQWRQPNVLRPNGKYKVQISWQEMQEMTAEKYAELTSQPRPSLSIPAPTFCPDLAIAFDSATQKVAASSKKKRKAPPKGIATAKLPSLEALMQGRGIKPGTGFQNISLQLAIAAHTRGLSEQALIDACAGLIANHESDGSRYNTPQKRERELRRMWSYTEDNPCYEFSVGGIKSLLNHRALDLDGLPTAAEDVEKAIAEAEANPDASADAPEEDKDKPHEYDDLAGVTLTKYGLYAPVEGGLKRVCALGFENVKVLFSLETKQVSLLEADVLVNGTKVGRFPLETDLFSSAQNFNKFCTRMGQVFQGSDGHLKGMYLRIMEKSKEASGADYAVSREGVDIIQIPDHEQPALREPFIVYADNKGVVVEPRVENEGIKISFQGFPESKGQFQSDLYNAPLLTEVIKDADQKAQLELMLENMLTCQREEAIAKYVGWTVACMYRMFFHAYKKQFPLLHINGAAGAGKTTGTLSFLSLFYYRQEPKMLTPESTAFAIAYAASSSASIPLVLDEFKPHEMPPGMHNKLKLMLRDAYNNREVTRGGGTRDNDDYRAISKVRVSSPIVFIGEALEDESAIVERSLVISLKKPTSLEGTRNLKRYTIFDSNRHLLSSIGQYMTAQIVKRYSMEKFIEEFDPILTAARNHFMLQPEDMERLSQEEIDKKMGNKDRSVYNHAVAEFGLMKLDRLLQGIFGERFTVQFLDLKKGLYSRMEELAEVTQPEWLKTLNAMSDMSYADPDLPYYLRNGTDFAFVNFEGKPALEVYLRSAYAKYRQYCRANGSKALYAGEGPFVHSIRDAPATVAMNTNVELTTPGGSTIFSLEELSRAGFRGFKA